MISLALSVVAIEAGICVVLIVQKPSVLCGFLLRASQVFNGGGPLSSVHKGIMGSMAFALALTLSRIIRLRKRIGQPGLPTMLADHMMLQTYFLEASLLGFGIFLFMIMCQLCAHICEIAFLRTKLEAVNKQVADSKEERLRFPSKPNQHAAGVDREEELATCHTKIATLESTVHELKEKMEDLQANSQRKDEDIRAAEANAKALQKQSEGFLLEYDRLLEDNQSLRSQLSAVDRKLHHSDSMKKKS